MAPPQPKITRLSSLDSIADIQDRIEQLESALATLKAKYQKLASRKKGKARASGTGLLGGHHTNTDDDNDDAGASFVWDNRSDWARYIRERQKELVEEWNKVVKNGDEEGQDRVYERTNAWDTVLDITR